MATFEIHDVPDHVVDTLRRAAAAEGETLEEHLRRRLIAAALEEGPNEG